VVNKNYELTRNYKNKKASIRAVLEDYATLTEAFIALYQVTFNEDWLKDANLKCSTSLAMRKTS